MEVTLTVCNVCKDPKRAVRRYFVQQGERSVTVDLCDEHDKPIETLLVEADQASTPVISTPVRVAKKAAAKKVTGSSPRRRGGRTIQETKIEEIK